MWTFFVSLKYLLSKREEKFISVINFISIAGVALGVAALIVVISVMTGFDDEIKERIIGTYSHIVIMNESGGINDSSEIIDVVKNDKDIKAYSFFLEKQAFLRSGDNITGIILRGVDDKNESRANNIDRLTTKGKIDFKGNGIILGSELKKRINARIGDKLSLMSPYTNTAMDFVVNDTFASGRYDYDSNMACISISKAMALFKTQEVTGIGLKVNKEFEVRVIKKRLQKKLGYPYIVRTWMDLDKNLMNALALEKKMMFIILGLIVVVACFNIASSLIMMVMEKTKSIGILRSIGATSLHIAFIFLIQGLLIGMIGAGIGAFLGINIASNIDGIADAVERFTGFELFPSDIYYLSDIPSKIVFNDVAVIMLFSMILVCLSGIYPALHAARLDPVTAVRYE